MTFSSHRLFRLFHSRIFKRHIPGVPVVIASIALGCVTVAHAQTQAPPSAPPIDRPLSQNFDNQQDTTERLWQRNESQQKSRIINNPNDTSSRAGSSYESALRALTQSPRDRLQQLMLEILNAVNRRDWFGADRLLRIYQRDPQHDPAMADFVAASRHASEGDLSAAIAGYRKVLETNAEFIRGELDLARALIADNQIREAQDTFQRLHEKTLPRIIQQHVDENLINIRNRQKLQASITLGWMYGDNINNANTVVNPCALTWEGTCFQNNPGKKINDSGIYFEASLNKLWPVSGHHSVLFRSLNYGNHYAQQDSYDNLASVNYLGYQYSSAKTQFQFLPSFDYDREGRYTAYRGPGFRTSLRQQLNPRWQVEGSFEYKHRDFSTVYDYLQGDLRSTGLLTSYALSPGFVLYTSLMYRQSDARNKVFAYDERSVRIGFFKAFGNQFTLNLAYGFRKKTAKEVFAYYGHLQRDIENSLYLNVTAPRWAWQGFTPTLTYEYRHNRSTIPHAYNYEKNRIVLGFSKNF